MVKKQTFEEIVKLEFRDCRFVAGGNVTVQMGFTDGQSKNVSTTASVGKGGYLI